MNPLHEMARILNRLIGSQSLVRRRDRRRRFWVAEALELRTLLTIPLYVQQTGVDNPMNGLAGGDEFAESHPVLVDLNDDLDFDLVVGRLHGISYFENIGCESDPIFMERMGELNPFSSLDETLGDIVPAPAFADWDNDGDLDLLTGSSLLGLTAFENMGTASIPNFALLESGNPFDGLFTELALPPVPAFADMDGDQDQDLVVSRLSGRMAYYENTSADPSSPVYASAGLSDPFQMFIDYFGSPALGDVDEDGDADLVVSSNFLGEVTSVSVRFFESTPGVIRVNLMEVNEVFDDQFSASTARAAPALGDLDGDGKQDLLLALDGEPPGARFRYYKAVENPVAFKPKNTVPGFQLAKEDIAVGFSVANGNAITVADPNTDGSDLQVTLSSGQGKLTLATIDGLNFAFSDAQGTGAGDGIKDATMTFRGTLEEINAALDGLTFRPTVDFSGEANLTIATNDLGQPGGGAALSDTDSVPIAVLSVATQVEHLQLEITLLVEFSGLSQNAADVMLRLLNLTGHPVVDAIRIKVFMVVVRVFGRAGILTEGSDQFLLERARDILIGITTRAC